MKVEEERIDTGLGAGVCSVLANYELGGVENHYICGEDHVLY